MSEETLQHSRSLASCSIFHPAESRTFGQENTRETFGSRFRRMRHFFVHCDDRYFADRVNRNKKSTLNKTLGVLKVLCLTV